MAKKSSGAKRQRSQQAAAQRRTKRRDARTPTAGSGPPPGWPGPPGGQPFPGFPGFPGLTDPKDPSWTTAALEEAVDTASGVHACDCGRDHHVDLDELMPDLVGPTAPATTLPQVRSAGVQWLRERLLRSVGDLWDRGWEPADALRVVRRTLPREHRALLGVALVEQLSRYSADSVTARWDVQLDVAGLPAREDGASTLAGALNDWPGGWASLVRPCVELLGLLRVQPQLPQVGPPPGEAARRARAASSSAQSAAARAAAVDARVLARVQALLAKAESTEYPAEAETFTAAAQSLMARHSIDAALLAAAAAGSAGPTEDGARCVRLDVDAPYENAKALLLQSISEANRCRAVWASSAGFSTVVGFPSDLLGVEVLYTSLLVQAIAGLHAAGRATGSGAHARSATFRRSYLHAYATRIGERLSAATTTATDEAAAASGTSGQDLLPVLAARSRVVDDAVDDLFPQMTSHASHALDLRGWSSGRAAADLASLARGGALGADHPG